MKKLNLVIKNKNQDYYLYNNDIATYLPAVKAINVIVGSNNSGKSRFLRKMMLNETMLIDVEKFDSYNGMIDFLNSNGRMGFTPILKNLTLEFDSLRTDIPNNFISVEHSMYSNSLSARKNMEESVKDIIIETKNLKKIYIPTLRTAHALYQDSQKIETDIYLETLIRNYSLNDNDVKVFTGIHLHKEILNARNAKKDIRKSFDNFEKFISKNFFDGKEVDIVAEFNKDNSLQGDNLKEIISVHIEGEKDRYLYELGDGIQAIIILMYQIFLAEDNSIIFIDEPELHLHPGMQRLFLEQLYSNEDLKKKNLVYFITTHSNHLLDLTIEKNNVSIYSFSSIMDEGDKKFIIRNVNAGDNEILQNLGVNNSSVFMANCSIWVEGISDRNYIRAFLKSYLNHLRISKPSEFKSIKEDIDFAFFEYAGTNIDHYFFDDLNEDREDEILRDINALALNNRILLLADSDNAEKGSKKRTRLEKLLLKQRQNFIPKIIEDIREIENLLTNNIWQKILINFCNKNLLSKYEGEISKKIETVLETIDYSAYETEYIGEFLNKISLKLKQIDGIDILNKSIYEQKTKHKFGTFKLKRELSELVLKEEFPWTVFAQNKKIGELTESIYKFITKSI